MAECLVRRIDKINTDPLLDPGCTKTGDIITVQDDGWSWGDEELGSVIYDVIKFPNIFWRDIEYLTEQEKLSVFSLYIQKRGIKLDVARLPNRNSNDWRGNVCTLNWPLATLRARTITKIPISDPNII